MADNQDMADNQALVSHFAALLKDVRGWIIKNDEALQEAPPSDQQLQELAGFAVRGISLVKQVI